MPNKMTVSRYASIYYLIQALTGIIWWLFLLFVPDIRGYFMPEQFPDKFLLGFWFADMVFFILGSLASAWVFWKGIKNKHFLVWFVTGGICYAAFYCLSVSLLTDSGWLAVFMMGLATVGSLGFTIRCAK